MRWRRMHQHTTPKAFSGPIQKAKTEPEKTKTCKATKTDGTKCKIDRGLDDDGLCRFHR